MATPSCPAPCRAQRISLCAPSGLQLTPGVAGWDPSSAPAASRCPCCPGHASAAAQGGFSKPGCCGQGEGSVCCSAGAQGAELAPAIAVAAASCPCLLGCSGAAAELGAAWTPRSLNHTNHQMVSVGGGLKAHLLPSPAVGRGPFH